MLGLVTAGSCIQHEAVLVSAYLTSLFSFFTLFLFYRGKLNVKRLSEIGDLESFLAPEDAFYYAMNTQQHNG